MSSPAVNALLTVGTVASSTGAAVLAIIPADEIKAASSAPAILILAAISAWLSWLLYKQGESYRKSIDHMSDSIRIQAEAHAKLAETMHNRPCVAGRRD